MVCEFNIHARAFVVYLVYVFTFLFDVLCSHSDISILIFRICILCILWMICPFYLPSHRAFAIEQFSPNSLSSPPFIHSSFFLPFVLISKPCIITTCCSPSIYFPAHSLFFTWTLSTLSPFSVLPSHCHLVLSILYSLSFPSLHFFPSLTSLPSPPPTRPTSFLFFLSLPFPSPPSPPLPWATRPPSSPDLRPNGEGKGIENKWEREREGEEINFARLRHASWASPWFRGCVCLGVLS